MLVLVLLKSTLIALVVRAYGPSWRTSWSVGISLGHVGEFAFILLSMATQRKIVTSQVCEVTFAFVCTRMYTHYMAALLIIVTSQVCGGACLRACACVHTLVHVCMHACKCARVRTRACVWSGHVSCCGTILLWMAPCLCHSTLRCKAACFPLQYGAVLNHALSCPFPLQC